MLRSQHEGLGKFQMAHIYESLQLITCDIILCCCLG